MKTSEQIISELDRILDKEKAALISGELDVLASLVEEKENLVQALNQAELSATEPLKRVSEKVTQNKVLLESALDGIRDAAKRLADLRQARKSLDTYNASGKKNRIEPDAGSKVERRA